MRNKSFSVVYEIIFIRHRKYSLGHVTCYIIIFPLHVFTIKFPEEHRKPPPYPTHLIQCCQLSITTLWFSSQPHSVIPFCNLLQGLWLQPYPSGTLGCAACLLSTGPRTIARSRMSHRSFLTLGKSHACYIWKSKRPREQ